MIFSRLLILFSLLGVLALFFLGLFERDSITGKVVSVSYLGSRIELNVEGVDEKVIIFFEGLLQIQEGDVVEIFGKEEIYLGETQVIADKIYKIS